MDYLQPSEDLLPVIAEPEIVVTVAPEKVGPSMPLPRAYSEHLMGDPLSGNPSRLYNDLGRPHPDFANPYDYNSHPGLGLFGNHLPPPPTRNMPWRSFDNIRERINPLNPMQPPHDPYGQHMPYHEDPGPIVYQHRDHVPYDYHPPPPPSERYSEPGSRLAYDMRGVPLPPQGSMHGSFEAPEPRYMEHEGHPPPPIPPRVPLPPVERPTSIPFSDQPLPQPPPPAASQPDVGESSNQAAVTSHVPPHTSSSRPPSRALSHVPSHHAGDLATIDEVNPVAEAPEPPPEPMEVVSQPDPPTDPAPPEPAEPPVESGAVSVGDTTEAASTINPDNPPPTEGGSEAAAENPPKKEKKKREKTPKPEPPPGVELGETDATSKRVFLHKLVWTILNPLTHPSYLYNQVGPVTRHFLMGLRQN